MKRILFCSILLFAVIANFPFPFSISEIRNLIFSFLTPIPSSISSFKPYPLSLKQFISSQRASSSQTQPLISWWVTNICQIISVLRTCGAHLHWQRQLVGEKMCFAAVAGNIKRLQSYYLAGADISQANFSGQTPLHFAILHRHKKTIKYLLEHGADPRCADMLGQIPADLVNISLTKLKRTSNGQSKDQSKAELLTLLNF